uniref:Fido domain-containing protein n=1 Tax=Ditylenchus dipsaci TaxID=166011 RepID=A0A915EGT6_9BILA
MFAVSASSAWSDFCWKRKSGDVREDRLGRLDEILRYINYIHADRITHPITVGILAHYAVVHVHPFMDANGRVSRILQDYLLMKAGYVPISIPEKEKIKYFDLFYSIRGRIPIRNDYYAANTVYATRTEPGQKKQNEETKAPLNLEMCPSKSLCPLVKFLTDLLMETMANIGSNSYHDQKVLDANTTASAPSVPRPDSSEKWHKSRSTELNQSLESLDFNVKSNALSEDVSNLSSMTPVSTMLSPQIDAFPVCLNKSPVFSTPATASSTGLNATTSSSKI